MNVQEAMWLVLMAERAHHQNIDDDGVRFWCGLDNRNGRMPVCVGEEELQTLSDEFNFISTDREGLVDWLVEVPAVERFRVLLTEYDEIEAANDFDELLRASDRIVEAVRVWAIGAVVRAAERDSKADEGEGDPTQGEAQDDVPRAD